MKRISQYVVFSLVIVMALLHYISSPVALILGFVFSMVLGNPFPENTKRAIHHLLKVSVIGLGFGMSVTETLKASEEGFLLTALSIFLTVGLGLLLIKFMGIDKKLGFLMTSGTSICGGSAIAAISPVIKANHRTISMAIGVIFFLNSIALFLFPTLGHLFHMSQEQFGLWCAIAIHDTSSVVGAAMEYGDRALQIATTVKLARTLWIIPMSFFAMMIFGTKNQRIKIPFFILGFIAAMLMNNFHWVSPNISADIVEISKSLLVVTLFLVGTSLTPKDVRESGMKPIVFSMALWVFISIISLMIILGSR